MTKNRKKKSDSKSDLPLVNNGYQKYVFADSLVEYKRSWSKVTFQLPCNSGEVPMSNWVGWPFNFHCEIFSLLDGEGKIERKRKRTGPNKRSN